MAVSASAEHYTEKMLRTLLALLLSLPLAAQNISTFFKEAFEERLRDEPEFATSVGVTITTTAGTIGPKPAANSAALTSSSASAN
jgi:hypothetical protein